MTKVRAFISFAAEDKNYRDLIVGQAKNPNSPIEIADWSVQEPFDEKWKTQCRERIKKTQLVIVLVGKTTCKADGACWEIKTAKEEGVPVFGVHINKDDKGQIPKELSGAPIIEWTWDGIANMIDKKSDNTGMRGGNINTPASATCKRCGRTLTNPTSVRLGLGSYCRTKV